MANNLACTLVSKRWQTACAVVYSTLARADARPLLALSQHSQSKAPPAASCAPHASPPPPAPESMTTVRSTSSDDHKRVYSDAAGPHVQHSTAHGVLASHAMIGGNTPSPGASRIATPPLSAAASPEAPAHEAAALQSSPSSHGALHLHASPSGNEPMLQLASEAAAESAPPTAAERSPEPPVRRHSQSPASHALAPTPSATLPVDNSGESPSFQGLGERHGAARSTVLSPQAGHDEAAPAPTSVFNMSAAELHVDQPAQLHSSVQSAQPACMSEHSSPKPWPVQWNAASDTQTAPASMPSQAAAEQQQSKPAHSSSAEVATARSASGFAASATSPERSISPSPAQVCGSQDAASLHVAPAEAAAPVATVSEGAVSSLDVQPSAQIESPEQSIGNKVRHDHTITCRALHTSCALHLSSSGVAALTWCCACSIELMANAVAGDRVVQRAITA